MKERPQIFEGTSRVISPLGESPEIIPVNGGRSSYRFKAEASQGVTKSRLEEYQAQKPLVDALDEAPTQLEYVESELVLASVLLQAQRNFLASQRRPTAS